MKSYPKILGSNDLPPFGKDCIVFDKLDGSNLRYEYSRKRGWYKFGTRNRLFDKSDVDYGLAIDLFLNKYNEPLSKIMVDKFPKIDSVVVYAEFLGPVSFAGMHDSVGLHQLGYLSEVISNDPKDVVLFDVNLYKKGFISPRDFLKYFSHLHIPSVLYEGEFTQELIDDVREGKFPVKEGVIAKGGESHSLWMRKIKTNYYLNQIKQFFGTGWKDYGE